MEYRRPTGLEAHRARTPLSPMPRLRLRPGEEGIGRTFVELACAGCVPGGCALTVGCEPGCGPEGGGRRCRGGNDDAKRRRAFAERLLLAKHAARRELPEGGPVEAHVAEPSALARIADGGQTAWNALAAEALAAKRFDGGCAVADGDVGACPGRYAMAIAGFGGWMMASWAG